jgi:hypothetical protein
VDFFERMKKIFFSLKLTICKLFTKSSFFITASPLINLKPHQVLTMKALCISYIVFTRMIFLVESSVRSEGCGGSEVALHPAEILAARPRPSRPTVSPSPFSIERCQWSPEKYPVVIPHAMLLVLVGRGYSCIDRKKLKWKVG